MTYLLFGCLNIIFFLNDGEWLIPQTKEVFFYEVQLEIKIYLLRNQPWINSLLFGSSEYTHNSELHVTPTKRHVRAGASQLDGITVSHFESVKSKFRSNHTSQYTRPSNSLRGLSKKFAI